MEDCLEIGPNGCCFADSAEWNFMKKGYHVIDHLLVSNSSKVKYAWDAVSAAYFPFHAFISSEVKYPVF